MPMQLKWQHSSPLSPAPSPKRAQACWQNALSCKHRIKVLPELLKQELGNLLSPPVYPGFSFFFVFCGRHVRSGSHGWEAGAGGEEEREGSLTSVPVPTSAVALWVQGTKPGNTMRQMDKPNNLLAWEGQFRACAKEVPETEHYKSWLWGLRDLKATKGPLPSNQI